MKVSRKGLAFFMDITEKLRSKADLEYLDFSKKIVNSSYELLGVRLPALRKLARDISKTEGYEEFLKKPKEYYEEVLLQGILAGLRKGTAKDHIRDAEAFLSGADSWGQTDSAIVGWKWIGKNPDAYRDWMKKLWNDDREFYRRTGYLISMRFYPGKEDTAETVKSFTNGGSDGYYVKMMMAWYLAERAVLYPEYVLDVLGQKRLDAWTHNKAIQKIKESFRFSKEYKQRAEELKR